MKFQIGETYVLDDIIPKEYQNTLFSYFTNISKWDLGGLNPNTTYNSFSSNTRKDFFSSDSIINNHIEEGIQLVSGIQHHFEGILDNEGYLIVAPILHYIHQYFNYSFRYTSTRVKANFQHQQPNRNPNKICEPHIDLFPTTLGNYTLIYYLNNSDGDTLLFDKTDKDIPIKEINIFKKITPKKGRCVFFPSNIFHSGNFPIKSLYRLALNINITIVTS